MDLAVAVDAAAFQPKLLDQPGESLVFQLPPGVVAPRMHIQQSAEPANRAAITVRTDEAVPHSGWLAKYTAAFVKMSRSSVTRLSSFFS